MAAEKEEDSHVTRVGESEISEDGIEPSFEKMKINFLRLCDGDPKAPIRFSVYSDNGKREDLLYGQFTSTIESLLVSGTKEIQLVGENNSNGGTLVFNIFEQVEKPNFIEYL